MLFPANIERSSLKTSMHLYCDVTSLCKYGAFKSYLFLVLLRVPLRRGRINISMQTNKSILTRSHRFWSLVTCDDGECLTAVTDVGVQGGVGALPGLAPLPHHLGTVIVLGTVLQGWDYLPWVGFTVLGDVHCKITQMLLIINNVYKDIFASR